MSINHLKTNIYHNRQEGVTLLLAILVLSSILAISFSLATIMFVEVRTAGDLVRTEPSFYASMGITEEAIFKVKRKSNNTIGATTIGTVRVGTPLEHSTASPISLLKIDGPKTYDTSETRLFFFDAFNNSVFGSGYRKVSITYQDTGNPASLKIYLCQYSEDDFNPCTSSGPFMPDADGKEVPPGDDEEYTLNISDRQELVLVNESSAPMYAVVQTYGPDANTPKGLPYSGEVRVEIQSSNSGLTRTLETRIPQ